jgi:carbonic anhydrase/acetyltransferase-like protein (isoleucine patch superfamily)
MAVSSFEGRHPRIGEGTWVHPSADVIGDVTIGPDCWIGPGARLRGDYGRIEIGECTAVEDNCVVHARPGEVCRIGMRATLGHACVVHTSRIADNAVIGMGAVVSDWAEVGEWAFVGEGAVVPQRAVVPPAGIAVGVPARILDRRVSDEQRAAWTGFKQTYVELAARYAAGCAADDRT